MQLFNEEKYLKKIFWINLVIILITPIFFLLKNYYLPEKVPLFFNLPWGIEQLASKYFLLIIPSVCLGVFILNFSLSLLLLKKGEKFIAIVSACFSLLFSILGIITFGKIIFLVA